MLKINLSPEIFPEPPAEFPAGAEIFPEGREMFQGGLPMFPVRVEIFREGREIFQGGCQYFKRGLKYFRRVGKYWKGGRKCFRRGCTLNFGAKNKDFDTSDSFSWRSRNNRDFAILVFCYQLYFFAQHRCVTLLYLYTVIGLLSKRRREIKKIWYV